jgi:hypothetical protein
VSPRYYRKFYSNSFTVTRQLRTLLAVKQKHRHNLKKIAQTIISSFMYYWNALYKTQGQYYPRQSTLEVLFDQGNAKHIHLLRKAYLCLYSRIFCDDIFNLNIKSILPDEHSICLQTMSSRQQMSDFIIKSRSFKYFKCELHV